MLHAKKLDLFAGIEVADYAAALKWYERLLGYPPTLVCTRHRAVCLGGLGLSSEV